MRIAFRLLLISFFLVKCLSAQDITLKRKINWTKPQSIKLSDAVNVQFLNFEDALYENSYKYLPLFFERSELPSGTTEIDVRVKNQSYEPLVEVSVIKDKSLIGNDIKVISEIVYEKKMPFAEIRILPIRQNALTGTFEKLVSFELEIHYALKANKKTASTRYYTPSSVLKNGNWYKIGITANGVYKLTPAFFDKIGIASASVNPANIRIYGNGGGMLPTRNDAKRNDDLTENSIFVSDNNDGVFSNSDYVLFYGQGPNQWTYNASENTFKHKVHLYSDTTYYFINVDMGPGKRIKVQESSLLTPTYTTTSFNAFAFHENNSVNFITSGQEWYGERFEILTSRDFSFTFPNIDNSEPVTLVSDVVAQSSARSSFDVLVNGSKVMTQSMPAVPGEYFGDFAMEVDNGIRKTQISSPTENISVTLNYNKANENSIGWLNYLELNARRKLIMTGVQMNFRDVLSVRSGNVTKYSLSGMSSSIAVWDVTDPLNPKIQSGNLSGGQFDFTVPSDTLREFISYASTGFAEPVNFGKIANQDLHSLGEVKMVIVAHPLFISEAERLAAFHRTHDNITVNIVTPQAIYNEFSSGAQDVTGIRDFMKMFYDRAGSDPTALPEYLLMFGDASYDYKRKSGNTNFVPSFQSVNSLARTVSYVTDDYFGLLDDNEGAQDSDGLIQSDNLDLSIGRFPVQTLAEAKVAVDKVIHYSSAPEATHSTDMICNNITSNSVYGDWRNVVAFVADDEDGDQHQDQADSYANTVNANYKDYNIDKIYFDAYKQFSTPGGQRFPDVTKAINKRVEKGALIINYTGHGGELGWAHERVLEVADISNWSNYNNLPLFMTATCEFSRFDDPARVSAGELVFLKPDGGGIALFTTVRLVFSSTNGILNTRFYSNVFKSDNGVMPSMGEVFIRTKNQAGSNRNFTLLGDPALRLAYPSLNVETTKINGNTVSPSPDTLKALSKVTVSGQITDKNGLKQNNFNGTLYPTVFDKASQITTLSNDGSKSPERKFNLQKNILYKGKVSVVNGEFTFSFLIPKDIAYQHGFGKISYYAENGSIDANGYYDNIVIGGSPSSVTSDNRGPVVKLFMNDDKFVSGGTTDESPIFYASVSDSSGVNTLGNGIGHDITATLDGDISNMLILNDYYQADLNSYQKGKVGYRLTKLKEGKHSLKFKVWDVYNNSSESYLEFVVANSTEFALKYVLNYPNPFTTKTSFYFDHNKPCIPLDVQIQVYTISGHLVKTIEQNAVKTEGYRLGPIDWDGRDDFGDKIAKGVYIYRVKVRSSADGSVTDKYEKLVILN